ncbi:MAG: hypothetical protein GXP54_05320 [Deltaproteobacteria bacterium]|nr:hypothetical protein [Deltaproteobacteria bacterium]
MNPEDLLERCEFIARDDVSGATELTLKACDVLVEAIEKGVLGPVADRLRTVKPMMASILNVVALAGSVDDSSRAAGLVLDFRSSLESAPARAALATVDYLKKTSEGPFRVLTISASSAVEKAIVELAGHGLTSSIVVGESRPMREGAAMARRLAERLGYTQVTLDAALAGLIDRDSIVLIGADAVLPNRVVNKVGSLSLCLASHRWSTPAIVVTTSHKVLSARARDFYRLPLATADDEGFIDVLFEEVPLDLVTTVVTEGGAVV